MITLDEYRQSLFLSLYHKMSEEERAELVLFLLSQQERRTPLTQEDIASIDALLKKRDGFGKSVLSNVVGNYIADFTILVGKKILSRLK